MIFGKKKYLRKIGYTLGSSLLLAFATSATVLAADNASEVVKKSTTAQAIYEDTTNEVLQAGEIASGVSDGCSWVIDANGKLTVRSVSASSNLSNSAWKEYKDQIKEVDIDVPYSSNLSRMFYEFDKLEKAKVKIDKTYGSAQYMFGCYMYKNWEYYSNLEELNIYQLNTSGITDMSGMFTNLINLEKLDLSGLDTSNVERMSYMFSGCKQLKDLNIKNFDTSHVTTMDSMFYSCMELTQLDLSHFKTSNVRSMSSMFDDCTKLESIKMNGWDVTRLREASYMFANCNKLTKLNIDGWNTKRLERVDDMFLNCQALKSLDLRGLDVSEATNMYAMFAGCRGLTTLKLYGWNTSNVTSMQRMFYSCSALKSLDLRTFDTSSVRFMSDMFSYCSNLESILMNKFDTSNVRTMNSMFYCCLKLKSIPVEKFSTKRLESASWMFYECEALKDLNLQNFKTPVLKEMAGMFYGCNSLTTLDLSALDLSYLAVNYGYGAVGNSNYNYRIAEACPKLTIIKSPKNLKMKCELPATSGNGWYRDDLNVKITDYPQNLSKSVTLHVQENGNKFVDVRKPGWKYDAAEYVYNNKYMSGTGTTKENLVVFAGDKAMTRAEFVQTLYNYVQPKAVKYDKTKFSDVANGKWYTNAIMWASEKELVSGVGNKKFGVNNKITRQDMVTILYKLAGKTNKKYIKGSKAITSFTDYKKVSDYAVPAMKWATGNKIVSGIPVSDKKYKLNPTGNTTRVECAAIIKNYITFVNGVK